jgi:hypothetical protein
MPIFLDASPTHFTFILPHLQHIENFKHFTLEKYNHIISPKCNVFYITSLTVICDFILSQFLLYILYSLTSTPCDER